jgi:hypothetical protein
MPRGRQKARFSLIDVLTRAFLHSGRNLRTVPELAAEIGVGVRSLQTLCKAEGTTAKDCLDFIRCLRIVADEQYEWNPRVMLSLYGADSRTIDRLIIAGGLSDGARPSVKRFLRQQRLVTSAKLCEELCRALSIRL